MTLYQRLRMVHRLFRYRWHAERAELRYLLGRDIRGGSAFDVGAHRGVYSYWMHRRFRDTKIVAFEPQRELVQHLHDFKQAFKLDRLTIEPMGLSSQGGMLEMHRPKSHWSAATLDQFYDDCENDVFNVPVMTIDDYVQQHPELRPVRFIKCDVECHEAEVLVGASRTLREDRPEIILEWSTPRRLYRERMFRLAQQLSYAIFQIECGKLTRCNTPERSTAPCWELGPNYVLLPHETAAMAVAA